MLFASENKNLQLWFATFPTKGFCCTQYYFVWTLYCACMMHVRIHDPISMIPYIFCTHYSLYKTVCFCKIMDEDDLQKEWQGGLFLGALFHSACNPPCCPPPMFIFALHPQRTRGLLGTGSPGQLPRLSHSFWALMILRLMLHYIHRDCTSTESVLGTCSPGRPPRLSHSYWAQLPVHRLFI